MTLKIHKFLEKVLKFLSVLFPSLFCFSVSLYSSVYLSLNLSIWQSLCRSVFPSLYLCRYLCLSVSLFLCFSVSPSLCLYFLSFFVSLSLCRSFSLSLCILFIYLSVSVLSISLLLCFSVSLPLYVFISRSLCLPISLSPLSLCLSVFLSPCLPASLPPCQSVISFLHLSDPLSLCVFPPSPLSLSQRLCLCDSLFLHLFHFIFFSISKSRPSVSLSPPSLPLCLLATL